MVIVHLKSAESPALSESIADDLDLRDAPQLSTAIDDDVIQLKSLGSGTLTYNLQDLLSQCDFSVPISPEEYEWVGASRVGLEAL